LTIQTTIPAAIEGERILLTKSQRITPYGTPKRIRGRDDIVFPISITRKGTACISKENIPKQCFFRSYSKLDEGDGIQGPKMCGFSSKPIKADNLTIGTKRSKTGKHPNQEIEMEGPICFLELLEDFMSKTLDIHPIKVLLEQR